MEHCMWCGKTEDEHLVSRPAGAPVPRVPCLLLKSGFRPKAKATPPGRPDDRGNEY